MQQRDHGTENFEPQPASQMRASVRFFALFGSIVLAAEFLLRGVRSAQHHVGWALFDAGVSPELAGFAAALTNGVFSFLCVAVLFVALEWKHLGFRNFRARYSEGVLYSLTAIAIAIALQAAVFYWISASEIDPLFKSASLGSLLIVFPVLYMLVIGFFEYWLHRALHDVPVLWRLHAIHHQIEHLNAARSYAHWAQDALYWAVITIPLAFLIETPHENIVLLTTFYLVSNYYMHSDNPALSFPRWLRHVLADNVYHHHHHSRQIEHWGRNYCSFFSFYDRLFGTQHMPDDETFHPTGIDGYRPLNGWRDYLVRPFTRQG